MEPKMIKKVNRNLFFKGMINGITLILVINLLLMMGDYFFGSTMVLQENKMVRVDMMTNLSVVLVYIAIPILDKVLSKMKASGFTLKLLIFIASVVGVFFVSLIILSIPEYLGTTEVYLSPIVLILLVLAMVTIAMRFNHYLKGQDEEINQKIAQKLNPN